MVAAIGFKIRNERRKQGLSQADLSQRLGISSSYLNLIESGKRKINVDLLLKVSDLLKIELTQLSKKSDANLYHYTLDLLGDNIFDDLNITNFEVKDLTSNNPLIAKALIRLGDIFRRNNKEIYSKIESISGENITEKKSSFPGEEVSDFLQQNQNYFPKLEDYALGLFNSISFKKKTRQILTVEYLNKKHKIDVVDTVPNENENYAKNFDPVKKILYLSDYITLETKKLYAISQIVQLEVLDVINEYLNSYNFLSDNSKQLARVALINYTAAAVLMPYKLFYEEATKHRYDLELLQHSFSTSFEQVAHRITCLQNPKMKGIPFHFLRVDIAGNISKRLSMSGIQIPRYGGACPRWNIHSAFSTPGKIHAAYSKMTDGEKYICIARTVEKGIGRHGVYRSMLSIGLGCQAKYAKDFCYADQLNLKDESSAIPIGVNCRTCSRMDCQQRAFPPLNQKFKIDPNKRGVSVYVSD